MNSDFMFHLRSLTRFIYYVCEEEDRFILELQAKLARFEQRIFVYNAAWGLQPMSRYTQTWKNREHPESDAPGIHDALIKIFTDDPRNETNFYVITDPDRWLGDDHVQRRILNIAHHLHNNERTVKVVIFVGPRLVVPQKLQRYIEVIHDRGLSETQLTEFLTDLTPKLQLPANSASHARVFRGLTTYEIEAAVTQCVVKCKRENKPRAIDPRVVGDFKRRQLHKTDLLNFVDVSKDTFDQVGGLDAFKEWCRKTKACWTDEGQKRHLIPPKGVLAVGVWGCGKSLSVKAMGHLWRLPVVQLEMGRLRSSGVGESEANVYRAINLIESVSPCVIWIDEAEKSLAGNQSSALSDAGTTSRTIGILSNWLQETDAPVCLAMTANSLKTLPVEFINRMDERFFFDLPNEDERIEVLKIHLLKRGQDPSKFQLAELSEAAKNMVGREMEQAIGASLVEAFDISDEGLTHEILLDELRKKPRIFRTMVDELKELLDWVGYDPDVKEGIRAKFASSHRGEGFSQFKVVGDGE